VPELDADQRALGCRQRVASHQGTSNPCDAAVALRDDLWQRGHLTDEERRAVCLMVPPDGGGIGLAPLDGHRLRHARATKRLGEDARGRPLVAQPGVTCLTSVEDGRDPCQVPRESSACVNGAPQR
jgi:hypothetical protein